MGKEQAQFFWMMFNVPALKPQSGTVSTMALAYTTVFTLKMLVYNVVRIIINVTSILCDIYTHVTSYRVTTISIVGNQYLLLQMPVNLPEM